MGLFLRPLPRLLVLDWHQLPDPPSCGYLVGPCQPGLEMWRLLGCSVCSLELCAILIIVRASGTLSALIWSNLSHFLYISRMPTTLFIA